MQTAVAPLALCRDPLTPYTCSRQTSVTTTPALNHSSLDRLSGQKPGCIPAFLLVILVTWVAINGRLMKDVKNIPKIENRFCMRG